MRASLLLLGLSLAVGCDRTVGTAADATGDSTPLQGGPCAVENVTGTLPGVTLAIRSASCVYKRGTPATFTYEVTTAGVPAITLPQNMGGCGDCGSYTNEPLSFTRYSIGGTSASGEHQQWCLCDQGCCFGTHGETMQVDDATASFQIQWSGRAWFGPSDTDNQEEDFFLPGRYDVFVAFRGFDQGSVEAALPIEIVP